MEKAESVAMTTVRSGILSCLLMGVIYLLVTLMGVWSRGALEAAPNGGTALAQIAQHYLGKAGLLVLAATVTLACLKTAVGLITSCAETFVGMFPKGLSYRNWVFVFTGISFLLANVGLTAIITYAVPVLMFLYPLAITLILLALLGHFFDHDRAVYVWVTGLTLVAALLRSAADAAGSSPCGAPCEWLGRHCGQGAALCHHRPGLDLPRDPGAGYWPDFPGRPSEEGITL